MNRCALAELFLPGGGFALRGDLRAAALAVLAMVLAIAACLVTPLGLYALAAVRLGAVAEAARRGRHGAGDPGWRWQAMILVGAVGVGTLVLARMMVVEAFRVPTESMEPTIAKGRVIIVDKVTMTIRTPERGEVIAFRMGTKTFVKRVMALGGDHVAVRGGIVHVNGAAVQRTLVQHVKARAHLYDERHAGHVYRVIGDEPEAERTLDVLETYPVAGSCGEDRYGYGTVPPTFASDSTCVVPAGTVFVMGDNRINSADSRYWGAVPLAWVFGRVVGVE